MLRLATDQNFNHDIIRGLLRHLPHLDVRSVQDAELSQAEDPSVLEWAASEGRILLTHDRSTMPDYAYERIGSGHRMPGVFVVSDRIAVGAAIDDLHILVTCSRDDEWEGRVGYVPLR